MENPDINKEISYQKENSYGNILKRIFSFGGVQIFNILINLIRGKFVALFLGPGGMGISSIFLSSTYTVNQMAGLGLNLVLVKEVATNKDEASQFPHLYTVAIRLILFTSILGALLCFALSPWLSEWSFGNGEYTSSFMILSLFVFLTVGSSGYLSLLQGLGEVKRLTRASLTGGLTGLFAGVPLYYFFGNKGIVPAMILVSLAMYVFYNYNLNRSISVDKIKFTWSSHKPLVKKLISLGVILMIGSLVGTLTNYLINIIVRYFGSIENVGFFQAANSLTNQYMGVVFSALAIDYFPRLSRVVNDKIKMNEIVNRQFEIIILVATPLVLVLILSTPLLINILLAPEFLVVTPLMRWMGFGVLLQAIAFPMGYLYLAAGNRKVYVWWEVVCSNIIWLVCSFIFYYYFGLIGLGITFVVRFVIDLPFSYLICRKFFGLRIDFSTLKVIIFCVVLCASGFIVSFLPVAYSYFILSILIIISFTFSFFYLKNKIKKPAELE